MATHDPTTEQVLPSFNAGERNTDDAAGAEHRDADLDTSLKCIYLTIAAALAIGLPLAFTYQKTYLGDGFFARKYSNTEKYDMVFVGDSRVIRGIDPTTVRAVSGINSYNFGFQALGLDYVPLDHATSLIDPGGRVRVLAIAISRPSLSSRNRVENTYIALKDTTPIERWNLVTFAPFEKFLHISPGDFLNGKKRTHSIDIHSNGFVGTVNRRSSDGMTKRDERDKRLQDTWVSEDQIKRLAGWIRKTKSRGIRIVVFRVPTTERMYKIETAELKLDLKHIRNTLEQAGAIWIDTLPFSNRYHSFDGSHLDGEAARKFTFDLCNQLRKKSIF